MPTCSLKQCSARKNTDLSQLTTHRFPKKEVWRQKWLEVIGSENINPRHRDVRVCSLHFEESSFNRTLNIIRLRDNAVPSLHLVPSKKTDGPVSGEISNLQQQAFPTMTQQRLSKKDEDPLYLEIESDEISSSSDELLPSTSRSLAPTEPVNPTMKKQKFVPPTNLQSAIKQKFPLPGPSIKLTKMQEKYNKQRKTIKRLNEKIRRQAKKIASMQETISKLKNKVVLDADKSIIILDMQECESYQDFLQKQKSK